eukprot:TRINITY_DN13536_c0_g2_i2.p1 TRINITY_DN13536_c0_g2~~TRINITY_DN13536_c0_g2_i2.p1  ORF type:complete len:229 (+),score=-14.76 TRINITY_DN13536_c0_g2_i2:159-845(+)
MPPKKRKHTTEQNTKTHQKCFSCVHSFKILENNMLSTNISISKQKLQKEKLKKKSLASYLNNKNVSCNIRNRKKYIVSSKTPTTSQLQILAKLRKLPNIITSWLFYLQHKKQMAHFFSMPRHQKLVTLLYTNQQILYGLTLQQLGIQTQLNVEPHIYNSQLIHFNSTLRNYVSNLSRNYLSFNISFSSFQLQRLPPQHQILMQKFHLLVFDMKQDAQVVEITIKRMRQ